MKFHSCVFAVAIIFGLQFAIAEPASDFRGADAVLKQVADSLAAEKNGKNAADADNSAKLRQDLKTFRETASTLAPEEAAKRWIELADRLSKLPQVELSYPFNPGEEPLSFATLIESLPPPAAWDALVKTTEALPSGQKAESMRTIMLRLLAHWLTGNAAAQKVDMAGLQLVLEQVKGVSHRYITQITVQLESALLKNSDDGEAILANLNKQLDSAGAATGLFNLQVPDLVSLAGEKKSAEFLRRALKTNFVLLQIPGEDKTQKLARKLALEMAGELRTPQWNLAESLDAAPLYEAMAKRFPQKADQEQQEDINTARTYYLLSLITSHRVKDAVKLALTLGDQNSVSFPDEGLAALDRQGHGKDVADFLHDLLAENPGLPLWDTYVEIAARAGDADKMLALAEAASQRKGLTPKQLGKITDVLAHAYLAVDKVDEGIDFLRKECVEAKKMVADANADSSMESEETTEPGFALAKLGVVLGRTELVDEGLQAVRNSINSVSGFWSSRNNGADVLRRVALQLMECDRGPEVEAVLSEALSSLAKTQRQPGVDTSYSSQETLVTLMCLYHRANRHADVLALLDNAPQWGAKDLVKIYERTVSVSGNDDYAGYFAASALAASGRKAEALEIVNLLLARHGGYDPAYELLIQLAPDEAITKLDALFARDQFEERPLIWKAKLLLDAGKLEEAEKCARQAISIDPTDGEEGPGRRLRAYAVLADIREARGDKKEAGMLHEVLTSVRNSDKADLTYQAGLVTRAMKMYEEALTHFADAYCIQARLAFRMAERGDMAGAEEHYRRAYELMPGSFGRMESFCFGCQGAFEGAQAQNIAEKVFKQLAEKDPQKPQIHYLLGYLFSEQNRYQEAMAEFRKAVDLDPDYLNAWKHIAETLKNVWLPMAERDAIQLNLLRLDPLGLHSDFDFQSVGDIRAAWIAMDVAAKLRIPVPETLYPLAASTKEIDRLQNESAKNPRSNFPYFSSDSRNDASPGQKTAGLLPAQLIGGYFVHRTQMFHD